MIGLIFGETDFPIQILKKIKKRKLKYLIIDLSKSKKFKKDKNSHNVSANQILFNLNTLSLGFSKISSKETHMLLFDDEAHIYHNMKGIYGSWILDNVDLFVEYVDKVSTEKNNIDPDGPLDSLKSGHGVY